MRLVDNFLSLSCFESGNVELEHINFNLPSCLEDVVSLLSPLAHKKGLEFILLLGGNLPDNIRGDRNRITQLLSNLVNNAIEFTDNGHVFVEADYAEHDGRQELHIRVSDTGMGLSQEEQEQLFQASPLADHSITCRFGGSGLDLAISKRLVTQMGGRISVQSRMGQGSEFNLNIPVHSSPVDNRMTKYSFPLSGRRVLIYDAHPLSRRTLRATLLHWGMMVFNTGDTEHLRSLLVKQDQGAPNFDLVLISLSPEESSGPEFLILHSQLRHIYKGPVLFLVGSREWHPPTPLGVNELVNWQLKPARRSILQHRICELLPGECMSSAPHAQELSEKPSPDHVSILVVEDNEFNRMLLKKLLGDRGATVYEVGSGMDAVEIVQHNAFDLILMDIHMPGLDGISAAQKIRTILGEHCPPIVSQTADVFADAARDNGRQVFDDELIKPVKPEALEAVINYWVLQQKQVPHTKTCVLAETLDREARHLEPPGDNSSTWSTGDNSAVPANMRAPLYQEIRHLWAEMKDLQMQMRWKELADLAHQFSGLCGLYELSELTVLAKDLEQFSRNEVQGPIPSTMQLLDTIINSLHKPR